MYNDMMCSVLKSFDVIIDLSFHKSEFFVPSSGWKTGWENRLD